MENSATLRVSQCLDELEKYLTGGDLEPGLQKCFDLEEAAQWRELTVEFGYISFPIFKTTLLFF